ncbi:MAG TPA: hypothetical protein PKM69_07235 [Bacteroidales bacterium]|nr:hypothetical protein [Bacteroidales bacterium]
MKNLLPAVLIAILSASLFTSCKKDKGEPPVLPPAESMTIDFSNFATAAKSAVSFSDIKGVNQENWQFSAVVAGIWNSILTTTLIVPVTAFKLAADQDPVYLSDKTWQWSYNSTVSGVAYQVRLVGQISSSVTWKLYLSTGTSNEFLWIEGTSNLDGKSGTWTINKSVTAPEAFLQIDWAKTDDSVASVKYTYIKTSEEFTGSYIEYGLQTGSYDAFYVVHYFDGAEFSDVNIEWNRTTHNGRVKSPSHFGDSQWHCWDTNLINVTC